MNIDDMPAGPEMDRLVAERVMGWEPKPPRWNGWWYYEDHRPDEDSKCFQPSTNIAHAWEVVDRMKIRGDDVCLDFYRSHDQWQVSTNAPKGRGSCASADTAPLAICRAALKAVS